MALITKGEYAALRKVSAARVAQYIATGHLDEALFHEDGHPAGRKDRYARIDVEKADAALRRQLTTTQVLGQGGELPPVSRPAGEMPSLPPSAAPATNDAAGRIQEAKAEREEMAAERERRDMAASAGLYTPTTMARKEFAAALANLLGAMETWLPELASTIASSQVDGKPLDRRQILITAKAQFREFRIAQAEAARRRGSEASRLIYDPLPDEESAPPEN